MDEKKDAREPITDTDRLEFMLIGGEISVTGSKKSNECFVFYDECKERVYYGSTPREAIDKAIKKEGLTYSKRISESLDSPRRRRI